MLLPRVGLVTKQEKLYCRDAVKNGRWNNRKRTVENYKTNARKEGRIWSWPEEKLPISGQDMASLCGQGLSPPPPRLFFFYPDPL